MDAYESQAEMEKDHASNFLITLNQIERAIKENNLERALEIIKIEGDILREVLEELQ